VIGAISSELFKLRSTRSFWWLTGVVLAIAVAFTILVCALSNNGDESPLEDLLWMFGSLAQALALLLGALMITTEFRHGTITPTLLVTPNRVKLMAAKVIAALLTGGAIGLLTAVAITVIVAIFTPVQDFGPSPSKLPMIVGGTLAVALFAALGMGVGALIRNQVGAIVGALGYVFAEPLLSLALTLWDSTDEIMPRYSLGAVSNSLWSVNPNDVEVQLDQLPGGLLLVLYVALFLIAGTLMMQRRDVTA
jgi:ABC-2 type transport system permease protein